jgi:hypothetical protein
MSIEHSHDVENANATTPPPKLEVISSVPAQRVVKAGDAFWEPGGDAIHYHDGNNLPDAETAFVVTMFGVAGQPMLIPVSAEELEERRDRRAPRS